MWNNTWNFSSMSTRLIPKENCVDVPKEVCARMRRNPRRVNRPVIKKWCYTPTRDQEQGSGGEQQGGGGGDEQETTQATVSH